MTTFPSNIIQLAVVSCIGYYQQEHSTQLCAIDRAFLEKRMKQLVPRMVEKFVKGAKEHGGSILTNVSWEALDDEFIDGLMYSGAQAENMERNTNYIEQMK